MSTEQGPDHEAEPITWNGDKNRFDWTVSLPGGRTLSGYGDTYDQARHHLETDWRVRGDQPRYVQRLPCGGEHPERT